MKLIKQVVRIFVLTLVLMTVFDKIAYAQDNAYNISFLSAYDQAVLAELNFARENPKLYAEKLTKMLDQFDGLLYKQSGAIAIRTNEGAQAVQEAIEFLLKQPALPKLTPSYGLSRAAKLLVQDQSMTGQVGHAGSNGSSPFDRMNQFGYWDITAGENISYGSSSPESVISQLIIDDGVPSRGHRKNVYNPNFGVVGISSGEHKVYRTMTVMDLAGDFVENKQ